MSYRALLIAVAVIIAGGMAAWLVTTMNSHVVRHLTDQFHQPEPDVQSVDVYLYIDPQTKCQYLYKWHTSLTPRLDASGKPMCQ